MEQITDIKKYADTHDVPIMMDEGMEFILNYIKENHVKNILEIGTAIGYSAINFAKVADDVRVSTIEVDIDRYQKAVKNVCDNNLSDRITLFLGDAAGFDFEEKFDLIFIDAAKAQYIKYFQKFQSNLADGGVIITDNLSFYGMVDDLSLAHNYSTIKLIRKIRQFVHFLKTNEEFDTVFHEVGDRISVSKRKA